MGQTHKAYIVMSSFSQIVSEYNDKATMYLLFEISITNTISSFLAFNHFNFAESLTKVPF